jgi:hypothetical protein
MDQQLFICLSEVVCLNDLFFTNDEGSQAPVKSEMKMNGN